MYLCMHLANTAILNIQIFSRRYHFSLWVFAGADEYYWMCCKVNDAKTFKNLAYYFMLAQSQIIIYCRLARLTGTFQIILI